MHQSYILLGWVVVATVLFQIASLVVRRKRYNALAKAWGCGDVPYLTNMGFLGLSHLNRMVAADEAQLFPDEMQDWHNQMCKSTGRTCATFKTTFLGQTSYFTSDPKNIQALLATKFGDFDLGSTRRGNLIATLGDGIFVQDGTPWEHSRALLRPNFVRSQVSDLQLEERHMQHLFKALPIQSDGWTRAVDLKTLFFRLTIDTSTEFLFGESVGSLSSNVSQAGKDESLFSRHFDSAQSHLAQRSRLGDRYWLHNPRNFKKDNEVVNKFVDHYVKLALMKGQTQEKLEEGKYVMLEELAQQTRDPEELRGQLLNILLAGRDTTASLLSWLFHILAKDPDAYAKLRGAIIDTFGTYSAPQEINFSTLKGCKTLQNYLNEALRLWPVVPVNARRSNKATTLPTGGGPNGTSPVFVPPQMEIVYSVHVTHNRADIWGEDAHLFKPERFESRRPNWDYIPFNGGPRICLGQQLALTTAGYVVVRLIQRFDKMQGVGSWVNERPKSNLGLTNAPGDGVVVRLHAADE
ncbi:putative P450 monooxygenase [Piedraia hortae CBS 480.64]|uniref:Putative P450 monooxygenase n=1 Tax=Piedraia hortae CBS 480.64 TaxID=1314780 RepID=A0A6A7BRF2_9PEZI|nr:putative P450 monooxygenase [Piedraia hortae CBS 480.64]